MLRYHMVRPSILVCSAFALFYLITEAQILTDHHQHLFSREAGANSSAGPNGISAKDLIAQLDKAGTKRAVVLSVAYSFSNPNKPPFEDEYAHVRAENDWTSAQVAQFPTRLLGFCSVNPVRTYALEEIARCVKDPHLRTGLKLHFGNSDVDVDNATHVAQLRRVFRLANENGMAIVVHMRPAVSRNRRYGAKQARIFVEQVLPESPDVTIQIAHLAGAGGYDDSIDEAVAVFVDGIAQNDPRMKNLYFDISGVPGLGDWETRRDLAAKRMRQLGLARLLYGSDAAIASNLPRDTYKRWRQTPLSEDEFRIVESNEAPYLRNWPKP